MKDSPSKHTNRPFKGLGALLKRQNIHLSPQSAKHPSKHKPKSLPPPEEKDTDIFAEAMAGVTPLDANKSCNTWQRPRSPASCDGDDDNYTVTALKALIRSGQGFIVSQTPEYMESANAGVGAEILRRLHQGHYAIQDFVDLHGYGVPEAEQVLDHFMRRSIETGLRAVLIVHGRGLTSPNEPVLKQKVFYWLTSGRLRKWVIALTSARSCDGGAGATYVLLRRHPMTKSQRRKSSAAPMA